MGRTATGAERPPVAAHAFVADLDRPQLDDADLHHLARVLRLRPGQPVTASDGAGGWRLCRWSGERAGEGSLDPLGPCRREERPLPSVTVGFSLLKGERPEEVVRRLSEAGVDRLVPLACARTVVRWEGPRASRNLERLRRVAREASMQSRRVWLPVVEEVRPFAQLVAELGGAAALAEQGGGPPTLAHPAVLVGPEGGWEDAERQAGPPLVGLGPTVLRADTAAVAAGLLLVALRAGLVAPGSPGRGRRGPGSSPNER